MGNSAQLPVVDVSTQGASVVVVVVGIIGIIGSIGRSGARGRSESEGSGARGRSEGASVVVSGNGSSIHPACCTCLFDRWWDRNL